MHASVRARCWLLVLLPLLYTDTVFCTPWYPYTDTMARDGALYACKDDLDKCPAYAKEGICKYFDSSKNPCRTSCDQCAPVCPKGWASAGDVCYRPFSNILLSWDDAKHECQKLGGNLAMPRTEAQQLAINQVINDYNFDIFMEIPEGSKVVEEEEEESLEEYIVELIEQGLSDEEINKRIDEWRYNQEQKQNMNKYQNVFERRVWLGIEEDMDNYAWNYVDGSELDYDAFNRFSYDVVRTTLKKCVTQKEQWYKGHEWKGEICDEAKAKFPYLCQLPKGLRGPNAMG